MSETFYIIDGHAQIYRAYYAPFGDLTSPTGEPTRATHVFCRMLLNLIRDRKPDYLAVVLDPPADTIFRRNIYPKYKANREPPPDDLLVQAKRISSILETVGVATYCVTGFEADDVIATMVEQLGNKDIQVYLVSKDKDLEQLMSTGVSLYDAGKATVFDVEALAAGKGYTPEQAVEVQVLAGDTADNIPGVQGIGVKTAAKLIARFGSAEAVIQYADELTPKMRQNIHAFADQAALTRELVTLRRDVPVTFDMAACRVSNLSFAAARPILEELGLTRLIEAIDSLDVSVTSECATDSKAKPPSSAAAPGDYELIDTPAKLDAFVKELSEQSVFAFDTETTGLNPADAHLVGLSFCWKTGHGYYIPIRAAVGATLPADSVIGALKGILENPTVSKVGQNIKYDLLVLRRCGVRVAGVAFDTMIADALLDPAKRSHSMDAMARALLDYETTPITDLIGKGKDQLTLDQLNTTDVGRYAAEDADITWRLKEVLAPRMRGHAVEALFCDTEMPLVDVLAEMEHNGIAINTAALKRQSSSMADRLVELTREIHRAAGHEFNIDSTKQLAGVLFDEQGLRVVKKIKTGRSTDATTLDTLRGETQCPIPGLVLEYRELAKLKSTYLDSLPKMVSPNTGRIHASFHQVGTVTGRLSSSNPNLQNIPVRTELGKQIRAAFVAGEPGHILLAADYSQIELRILAHLSGDPALVTAFRQGQDIHAAVAAQINGVAVEDVTSDQRRGAKAVNFGIVYGQSPFGLSRALDIPMADAKAFIDAYFDRYAGVREFIRRCITQARSDGFAQTMLKRRRPIAELGSTNRQTVALGERLAVNTVVQGSAADLIKRAMVDIHHELQLGGYSAKMLIQVHDELVFEVAECDAPREADMIRKNMTQAIPLDVPVVVDIAWGPSWLDCKPAP